MNIIVRLLIISKDNNNIDHFKMINNIKYLLNVFIELLSLISIKKHII